MPIIKRITTKNIFYKKKQTKLSISLQNISSEKAKSLRNNYYFNLHYLAQTKLKYISIQVLAIGTIIASTWSPTRKFSE